MERVKKYLENKGNRTVREFCIEVFESGLPENMKGNISLQFFYFPVPLNGFVKVRKQKYQLWINLCPITLRKSTSPELRLFYFYTTLLHEMRHITILQGKEIQSYMELLAYWEEISQMLFQVNPKWLNGLGNVFRRYYYKFIQIKNYKVSVAELCCNVYAYERAYSKFLPVLNEVERKQVEKVIDALNFLKEHVAITYLTQYKPQPYNLFVKMVGESQQVFRKNQVLLNQYEPMRYLFTEEGKAKNIENLYAERTENSREIIDGLIINWLICTDIDYTEIFLHNNLLKLYVEKIINEYCQGVCKYLTQLNKAEVFWNQEMIKDNTVMLTQNSQTLITMAQKYELKISCNIIT